MEWVLNRIEAKHQPAQLCRQACVGLNGNRIDEPPSEGTGCVS